MAMTFDGQRAYGHVHRLAVDIGPRLRGSPGDERAAAYIAGFYRSLGLAVTEQPFEILTGSLLEHRLEILDPPLGEIPSWPMLLSPDTPPEGAVGDVVFVEGTRPPYVGPHLEGKIVLHCGGPSSDSKQIFKHRPLAVVQIPNNTGLTPRRHAISPERARPYDPATGFFITYEDGLRLVQGGARKARVLLRSERRMGTTRNVVAELRGSEHPDEIIVVGGHYDSNPEITGATDDAAGTAVAMELARLYAARGARRTMRFIAWGAEEGGCVGSRHHVRELKKRDKSQREGAAFVKGRDKTELEQHLLSVAVDVVGTIIGYNVCYCLAGDEIKAAIDVLGKELGMQHEFRARPFSSDHEPFVWAGVPGVCFAREGGGMPYLHGIEDRIEIMDAGHLQAVGKFVDTFLDRAVNALAWPFRREVPPDIAKMMVETMKGWGEEVEEPKQS